MVKQETVVDFATPPAIPSGITGFEWVPGFVGYDKDVEYLLDGLLPAESFGVVYGASGSFKSFLAFSWALHIATGKDWSSYKVTQKSVLYVVAEGGIGAPRRVKAWCDKYNNGQPPKGFYRLDIPAHMASWEQRRRLEITIDDIQQKTGDKIGLIVLDTLARCFAGGDENSTKDMNDFIAGCDNVKAKTKATILVVHHSGKNEEKGGRGSSALRAACDFEYKVRRPPDGSHTLILSCEKMKDDEPINCSSFKLETTFLHLNEHGREINSLYVIDEAQETDAGNVEAFKAAGGGASEQQAFLWKTVKQRRDKGEPANVAAIRDKFKAKFGGKHFSRALNQLQEKKLIFIKDEEVFYSDVEE